MKHDQQNVFVAKLFDFSLCSELILFIGPKQRIMKNLPNRLTLYEVANLRFIIIH